eukprot:TRINITY_DN3362_c0_g1_i17.p1 TRINITY_DN3362_c0_g1~~TRINITY_DN3362_c0_g1_i17.p1  ORF type:complete len:172 (-),score=25.85 TRINITY_DN3362_c0_g1_i17:65-580(-)
MLRGPPRSPLSSSSAASDVYKRQTLQTTKNLTLFKMLNHLFGRKGYTTEVRSQVDWCRPRGCMVGPGCSMLRHANSDGGPVLINVYYGAQESDWQNVEQEKWWGGLTPAVRYCGIENGNISFWPDSDRDARYGADNLRVLSLIHISEPTRLLSISYAVFCLKKKKKKIHNK